MIFKDLNSLKNYLIEDQKIASINPIRFINVDSMDMWVETKKVILSLCDKTLFLSDFCESDDTTPNIRRVMSRLKVFDKTTLVAPLSEYLRIKPDVAHSTILRILSTEYKNNDDGKMRIYFLMYRMRDILQTIPNDDPRRQNAILYFATCEESDYSLTIIQDDLNVSIAGNEIYGFKSYLEYWEQNPDKPLILHTKNAIYFEENNFFDNVKVISNSFDLLKFRYELPSSFKRDFGDKNLWNELAKIVALYGDFESACKQTFNTNRYSIDRFEFWNRYSDFYRWLLLMWSKTQLAESYVVLCAQKALTPNDFIEHLYLDIVEYLSANTYFDVYFERKKILQLIGSVGIPEAFWQKVNSLDILHSLKCLTDITEIEKKAIFNLLQRIDEYSISREYLGLIKTIYPDLGYYLSGHINNPANLNNEIESYFAEYKWLKVINKLTSTFNEKVKHYALTKGEAVYSLKPRREIINDIYDDETAILFVDGLGAEYLEYISYLFADLSDKEYAISYAAGYCHLPTITSVNKDFLAEKRIIDSVYSLDELKHSTFSYPSNITKELDVIRSLKDTILNSFNQSIRKIILATDHGTSRLAVLIRETEFDKKIPSDGIKLFRYGRYCEGISMESELDTAINDDNKLIFADYSRFEQKGAPSDEIHGGASMEEWIVPIICIEKIASERSFEKISVQLLTPIVSPELGTDKVTVEFLIKGTSCQKVYVLVNGQRIVCKNNNNTYAFDYVPRKGESEIKVKVFGAGMLGEVIVQVKQKISQNKKFDI